MQTTDATIRDFVVRDFRAAAVFHRYGIDFCCGGGKTLGEVCRSKQLEESALLREISQACATDTNRPPQFADWEADALTRHIVVEHHGYVRSALPTIAAHARKLAKVHGPAHPALVEVADIFDEVSDEMTSHMMKEEQILFPYIDQLAATRRSGLRPFPAPFGDIGNPIRMMEMEHESAGGAMARIRALTNGYTPPEEGCMTWRVTMKELEAFELDLHAHVHLENNILFPKARALAAPAAV